MTAIGELWPDRNEYDLAVARWTETISDPELRNGKLDYDHLGIRRYGGANLYICVYRISNWMIRCFCSNGNRRPPADIRERYQAIARFSQEYSGRVSALTPITYDEQGIRVGSRVLPLVKMPFFANCPSLGEFVTDHYTETSVMQQLCDAWLRMIGEMEAMQIAHGDLDLSNVLIEQRGPAITLRLIDYDNMWVPSLAGHSQTEYGHQHFQHPAFMPPKARPYTAGMDRFSALVIFISLRALVAQPQLYDQWGADESERLLFAESDYQNTGLAGNRIARLRELGVPDLYPYIDELLASLRDERMPRSLPAITSALYRPPMPPPGAPRPPRAVWSQAQYNTPATPSISLAPLPRGDLRSGDLQSMGAAKMFSPQPAPPAVVPTIKENNAPRSPDVMQVAAGGPTGKHHLWLWVVIGVVIGLLIVAALALALLFMPGLRSGSASQPALLPAAILDESTLSAQTTAFQAALNVSPNSTGPNTCIPQGSAWSCSVTLSASHIPPFGGIFWRANASSSRILVNPSSGTVFLNKPVQVTISGLPCSAEQVTFSGTENGQPVNPATMFWNCTPTPTPAPSPTPTPMLSPTPTPEPTPTSTPKPSPTPLLSATPSPTPTPASTSTPGSIGSNGSTGPGGSPPSNTGGLPDSLPVGGLLAAASLLLALLAFLLYLLPRPGEQSTLLGKLRSLIIPDGLLHR